ncbi:ABC transporter permease [Chloroflexota bacterium]
MSESAEQVSIAAQKERKRHSFFVSLMIRLVKEKPLGTVGGILVVMLFGVGIFANLLAPYDPINMVMVDRLQPSSFQHFLGTDNLGRDLLSRIIFGARVSMTVGLSASALYTLVAVLLGTPAGYIGGKFDMILQRFVDAKMCFPTMILYLSVLTLLGPGMLQVILVMGIAQGINGSRVVRGAVMGIKSNVYFDAARAIGASNTRMIFRHVLPNVLAPIMVITTIRMGGFIITEATLSFLGFGIPPPTPAWGGMLSGAGRQYMYLAPWMAVWPGLALALAVYGMNMLGDAMRDLMDPRLRGGIGRFGTTKSQRVKKPA